MGLCIRCKGKGFCGRPICPVIKRFESQKRVQTSKTSIFGASPPSVFIGRAGYPSVSAGPLLPSGITGNEASNYDSPEKWLDKTIEDIISLRSNLIRSKTTVNVKKAPDNRLLQQTQEIALSIKPIDTEILFEKPPVATLRFDDVLTPMGPSGDIKKLDIAENPVVPNRVDAIVSDTDVLSTDAINELYTSNISEDYITRLLSAGLIGRKRKLVPTRWSITATDDSIGKQLIREIQYYPEITDITVHSGELFGNHFEILLLPRHYSFELMEIWMPKSVWNPEDTWIGVDSEDHHGKKGYSTLGGGYYAARLPILEHLQQKRRCATTIAIREVLPGYWAPLGVWVVREAARLTLTKQPMIFETIEGALNYIYTKINSPKELWQQQLKLLTESKTQRTLNQYFNSILQENTPDKIKPKNS